ncbi:ABC transporter substrate-binding protein [Edaphobacter acidisoli]|uniref:ABC transporter substrate-binding protein n=1 Tax=Edaphobacter acidisoli TaxID=2040573 RepID=A0A916RFU8_9BACT|nr:extracellular solute-binding protein [Edaphobacter acidisoli]GGA55509.1 ABC transporter substrate-binding protein [Edaphobacter acidisoli]
MSRSQTFRIAVRKYPPFEETIRQQWQHFESEAHTGLTLDLVPLDLHPLEDALFTSKGMATGAWDVAFIATDWIASMHEQQCAVDLAPLLKANPPADYPEGWADSLLRLQRIGPAILGVPFHDGPECLIYRKDIFEDTATQSRYLKQFGEPLAPPKTWAEFHRIARFLHAPEKDLYGTVFAAYPDGHNTVYDFLLQLWTRGGELIDANGNIQFHTPAAEAALTFYREIIADHHAVHPACRNLDSVKAGLAFSAGNVAMMINWFGFATMAHTSSDSAVRGLVDIAPIPSAEQGSTVSLNVYWILSIATGSPHQQIAWQFLRHNLTPAMDKLTTTLGAIGCRKSTWRDPEVNRAIPFYHRIEQLHANAHEIPQRSDWPRVASIIDHLVTQAATTSEPIPAILASAGLSFN